MVQMTMMCCERGGAKIHTYYLPLPALPNTAPTACLLTYVRPYIGYMPTYIHVLPCIHAPTCMYLHTYTQSGLRRQTDDE